MNILFAVSKYPENIFISPFALARQPLTIAIAINRLAYMYVCIRQQKCVSYKFETINLATHTTLANEENAQRGFSTLHKLKDAREREKRSDDESNISDCFHSRSPTSCRELFSLTLNPGIYLTSWQQNNTHSQFTRDLKRLKCALAPLN